MQDFPKYSSVFLYTEAIREDYNWTSMENSLGQYRTDKTIQYEVIVYPLIVRQYSVDLLGEEIGQN
jgi:hypothetical protein